jgi:uncharacterized surface protein with fasciclin (FAS1) repeats
MYKKIQIFVFAVIAASTFSCKTKSDDNILQPLPIQLQGATKNAMEVIETDPQFSSFSAAIKQYGLENELRRFPARFTIFAPNNAAFASANLTGLSEDQMRNVLRYHILQAETFRFSTQLTSGANETAARLPNNLVWLNVPRVGEVYVNGGTVVRADIPATNAVLHEVDKVLIPPTKTMYQIIAETPNLSIFRRGVNSFPSLPTPTSSPANIRQILQSTRFVGTTAVDGATSAIFGGINATVFVPNDAAFAALTPAVTDTLGAASFFTTAPTSTAVLHHVSTVSGRIFSKGILAGPLPSLVGGRPLNILLEGGNVILNRKTIIGTVVQTGDPIGTAAGYNNAKVVTADIIATNGVIHVIDRVLRPEN